jgi:flagellar biosynthesis protein FliR
MVFMVQVMVNVVIGAILGYIGYLLIAAVASAGAMINAQLGLNSAMLFDPTTRTQTALLDPLFSITATLVYVYIGGIEWLLKALQRSYELFPLYRIIHNLPKILSVQEFITLSGNTLVLGVQFAAPVFLSCLLVDIMLGVLNKTAQQMPVFQLSASIKPIVGLFILWMTLPQFIQVVAHYLTEYKQLF